MDSRRVAWVVTDEVTVRAFLIPLLAVIAERRHVTLFTRTDDASSLCAMLPAGVELRPMGLRRRPSPLQDVLALVALIREFKKRQFVLVHTLTPKAGLLGMLAAFAAQVPVRIHTFQGEVWATRTGLWRRFLRASDRLVAKMATHVTVVSAGERQFLLAERIIANGTSSILANGSICGVDFARFRPDARTRQATRASCGATDAECVFFFLGRITRDKGLRELFEAFCRLSHEALPVLLWVAGADEEYMIEGLIASSGGAAVRIRYLGTLIDPQPFLAAADVLVLPSHREGFGMAVVEAAGCEVPAIISDIYGLRDVVIPERTGLVHRVGDQDALYSAMNRMARDRSLRLRLGKAAREFAASRFSRATVVAAMGVFYAEQLNALARARQR